MATTKTRTGLREAYTRYSVYAPIGAAQVLIEKSKELSAGAIGIAQRQRKRAMAAYDDLAERGEKLVRGIRRSGPTMRAVHQVRTARSRVKAAGTSVGKA